MLTYLQAVVFVSKLSSCTPPSLSHLSVKMVLEGTRRSGIPVGTGAIPLTLDVLKSFYPHVKLSCRADCVFGHHACSCFLPYYESLM